MNWISIHEQLPPFGVPIFLRGNSGIVIASRFDDPDGWLWGEVYDCPRFFDGKWNSSDAELEDLKGDYWMPFPSLP